MINIFCTFLWHDFLRLEFLNAVHQLLFVAWFHCGLQKELEFVPQVLDRIEVRTFGDRFPQVDAVLLKEGLCSLKGMLWVIILHKTMIGQLLSDKRDQSGFKDVAEENSIHDTIKDANLRGTMSTDPTPNMNFNWMLWFWLALHRLIDLPVAGTAVLPKGNGAFVGEDHIVKSVSTFQHTPCVLQSFHIVWGSDELTIRSLQPSFFLVLHTVAEHTEILYFSSFWIWLLVISSFFCIC